MLWSVTAKDCTTADSDLITRRVPARSSRDGIILLHDLYDGTVPAVPGIIDALKKRGVRLRDGAAAAGAGEGGAGGGVSLRAGAAEGS